jgi:hypothetical protein
MCECVGTDSFILKPDPRSERSRALKCAKINNGSLIPSNRTQYVFKVLDQYEQTQWFTAIDAEIREKKEPIPINVLPAVISMDALFPSGLNEKPEAQASDPLSSSTSSRNHRQRKGSLESSKLEMILNRNNSSKDSDFGAGVSAEWHGMDIAADFISSDIRRAQHRGKNRAFPVQNIAVTRTPLDMGLVDNIRLAHSPDNISKDDSVLPSEVVRKLRSNSRRGSADDVVGVGRSVRRGSADDIVVPSLTMRQRLTSVTSKPVKARSDWSNGDDMNQEVKILEQIDSQLLHPTKQLQPLDVAQSETAVKTTSKEDESLEEVFAAASEQLKATKEATARLSRALALIEEMKTRWNALLESELQRLDVPTPHSRHFSFPPFIPVSQCLREF